MQNSRPLFIGTLALIMAGTSCLPFAAAAPQRYSIEVPAGLTVATGTALIMSSRGLDQIPIEGSRDPDGTPRASVLLDPATLAPDAAIATMLVSESGEVRFTPIATTATLAKMPELPPCPAERDANLDFSGQHALLESLVRLRSQYRDGFRTMMSTRLNQTIIQDLSRLEELFGLTYAEQLSPELPLPVLLDRLARLTEAVRNYKAHKELASQE